MIAPAAPVPASPTRPAPGSPKAEQPKLGITLFFSRSSRAGRCSQERRRQQLEGHAEQITPVPGPERTERIPGHHRAEQPRARRTDCHRTEVGESCAAAGTCSCSESGIALCVLYPPWILGNPLPSASQAMALHLPGQSASRPPACPPARLGPALWVRGADTPALAPLSPSARIKPHRLWPAL